ncbi:DUF5666 domain-containing protein [Sporichthya sp.]|uniref:DUF5666 domain-containing protein n=1 Tax=Sporichthya sp. TaxID=65475 RepID=UPI0017DE244D|nr:DUF5666 domain-containing protein [Sporichthya sp.]MBA3743779.1 hypothetical protein [Sporichthya sp.]
MDGRTWSRAAMLALAVALPISPVVTTTASATTASVVRVAPHGSDDGAKDDRADRGEHKQKGKAARAKFNLGGRLTAVDVEAGTVTFRVHGGKFKAVRGTELTVIVADGARVRRNEAAATLADLQVGDRVRAKGLRHDGVWTAKRVKAESPDFHHDDSADDSGDGNSAA